MINKVQHDMHSTDGSDSTRDLSCLSWTIFLLDNKIVLQK